MRKEKEGAAGLEEGEKRKWHSLVTVKRSDS